MREELRVTIAGGLGVVSAEAWDGLAPPDDPFLRHAFLWGLEETGCVGGVEQGWAPAHVLVHRGERLVGACPAYVKYDSYGEYIFDFGWAHAAARAGIPYYPKVVSAVPFTPAGARRLLIAPGEGAPEQVQGALLEGLLALAEAVEASSVHLLFCGAEEADLAASRGFLPRLSYQFHWGRGEGWETFEDHLAAMTSRARKETRRERAKAQGHGLSLAMEGGAELDDEGWEAAYRGYRDTVARKGGYPYLTQGFFDWLRRACPDRIRVATAREGHQIKATALFLEGEGALFGRYWGGAGALDALHFELCYHLPIEWSLAQGHERFEAGAQGHHKLRRGLLPRPRYSAHWLRDRALRDGVAGFLRGERAQVAAEMEALSLKGPYRQGPSREGP